MSAQGPEDFMAKEAYILPYHTPDILVMVYVCHQELMFTLLSQF